VAAHCAERREDLGDLASAVDAAGCRIYLSHPATPVRIGDPSREHASTFDVHDHILVPRSEVGARPSSSLDSTSVYGFFGFR
jgi:hypothetical protein